MNEWTSKSKTVRIIVLNRDLMIQSFFDGQWSEKISVPFTTTANAYAYFNDLIRKLECLEKLGVTLMVFSEGEEI